MKFVESVPNSGSTMTEVRELVSELEKASLSSSRGKSYKVLCNLTHSSEKVVSWKFNEWDYGKNNISLPCNARGLFISADPVNPRIVARGYDKFFNIDEVATTKWKWISENTVGPYEVSVKANGCIIFISGLKDGSLVVCSKHSTGPRADVDRNHAEAGEAFLLEQLSIQNVDSRELGLELYNNDVTAVAEYCDDTFEEHILEYTGDKRGLYLHGVNKNSVQFSTWPSEKVTNFAQKYGFKTIEYIIEDSMKSLKAFLSKCSQDGTFEGREIEGFVIRSHLKANPEQAFFFKFKFEEPYLMYRQWREVTKKYISTKSRTFKFKKHSFITNKYLDYVIPILETDTQLCEDYMKGFGIIKLRNMFLESYGMSGLEILNHEKVQELELRNAIDYDKIDENTKFLIFPISVIGCGKSTTASTLVNLYPDSWGHIQNDDIHGKDKSMLMKRSLELLAKPGMKCVFVDRNNHQFRERKQLFEWVEELKECYLPYDQNIKIIGVSFAPYDDMNKIKDITVKRVLARGDNHQTIKLDKFGEKKVIGIMSGFWKRYQPFNDKRSPDDLFDMIINLEFHEEDSSLINAKKILEQLHQEYPILVDHLPKDNEIKVAFEKSLAYKVPVRNVNNSAFSSVKKQQSKKKKIKPEYFSLHLDHITIKSAIDRLIMQNLGKVDPEGMKYLNVLVNKNRYQPEFHVTLCHVMQAKKGNENEKKIWETYMNYYKPVMEMFEKDDLKELPEILKTRDNIKIRLVKLVWDDKIATIIVDFLLHDDNNTFFIESDGQKIEGFQCANRVPHITIGTLEDEIKPVYSNTLCQKTVDGDDIDSSEYYELEFHDLKGYEGEIYINI